MTLGDLQPNDAFVSSTISFMTQGGATAKVNFKGEQVWASYTYWAEGDGAENGPGWYLEADEDATVNQNAVLVPFDTGLLVYRDGSESDATLTYSGAVDTEPVTKSFPNAQYTVFYHNGQWRHRC